LHQLVEERPDVHFVLQHHDLYWEGPNARNFHTPYPEIADLIARTTCPDRPNTTHVLINPIAASALRERRGIEGVVIPDGFDFDRDVTIIDEATLRSRLEVLTGNPAPIGPDDLVVAMPARVAINKAIELAIQFVSGLEARRAELEDVPGGLGARRRRLTASDRIVLLLPQGEDLDENRRYFDRLVAYAANRGISLAYGGNVVVPDRRWTPGDREHFPFYSTYQAIDLVCYPPEHEGFGNQAIEAVWAKRPLAVLEYPVFEAFVRSHIPHYISLGSVAALGRLQEFGGLHLLTEDILERALDAAIAVLKDHDLERSWVEENAISLRRFCGIDTVSEQYVALYDAARRMLPEHGHS
jgi:mannosylglucosylglycerate synthase